MAGCHRQDRITPKPSRDPETTTAMKIGFHCARLIGHPFASSISFVLLVVGSVLSRMGERQLRESYSIFRENGNEEWAWTVADTQHWFTPESQSLQVCASIRSIDGGSSKRELLSPSLHHCVHQIDGKIRSYILLEDDSGNKLGPNPKQRPVWKKWSDDSAAHPHATILGSMVKPH